MYGINIFEQFGHGGMGVFEVLNTDEEQKLQVEVGKGVDAGRVRRVLKMREVNERIQSTFLILRNKTHSTLSTFLRI